MMKLYPLFAAILFMSLKSYGQTTTAEAGKWRLINMHWTLGVDVNDFKDMSYVDLLNLSSEPENLQYDLSIFQEEARTTTGGGLASFRWSLSPSAKSESISQEVQMGLTYYGEKEAMVSFKNEDLDTSLVFCNVHSEIALELAYVFSGNWGSHWRWHLGMGINGGTTFQNQMILLEGEYFEPGQHPSNQEVSMSEPVFSDAKSVRYARAYIPFGLHYNLTSKLSLGLDFRKGFGWQIIPGHKPNFIKNNLQFGLGLSYSLI